MQVMSFSAWKWSSLFNITHKYVENRQLKITQQTSLTFKDIHKSSFESRGLLLAVVFLESVKNKIK